MSIHADIGNFLSVAWEAANAAGAIIRENWQQPKTIDYKGAIDLVTSVDRECERQIVDVIRRNFPDHSILAEEETDVDGAKTTIAGSSIRSTAQPILLIVTRSFPCPSRWSRTAASSWGWFTIRCETNVSKRHSAKGPH